MDTLLITKRIALLATSELPPGQMKRCNVAGFPPLAVYNVDGEVFITNDTCTHGMASLCEGELHGDVIECPWHGGAFHVRTGLPAERPCTIALKTYTPIIEDGTIFIEVVPK